MALAVIRKEWGKIKTEMTKKEFTIGVLKSELCCGMCRFTTSKELAKTICALTQERVDLMDSPCKNYTDWRGSVKNE
jgi:hypothetical protein